MRRLALLLAAALTLAGAGTAGADTFEIVPSSPQPAPRIAVVPNEPGSIQVPEFGAPAAQVSLSTLRELWGSAGATYGIPWQVLAAINKIETDFGRNLGPSSAGAIGWMQFMPSTWVRWGMDANADGFANPSDPADAIYSAARYLAAAGGIADLRRAVFAYNHADWYVNEVLSLATLYSQGGADAVFSLDRLQVDVDASRKRVAEVNVALVGALARARELRGHENRLLRVATAAPLVSTRLSVRRRAVQVGLRRDAADRRVEQLRTELAQARSALAAARDRASGASFTSAAAALLSAPTYSGSYVFPVGGGAEGVSVSSGHHDYPAADIAAPEGSPVYALADTLVLRAWAAPSGNCGIGATLATADGHTWTYCHLSYLDGGVRAGATLAAGAPVGLVGHTGRATGPHLHLQLDPTSTGYPQDEAWFRAFAGTAFHWGDESPARALASASSRPLFVLLGQPEISFSSASDEIAFTPDVVYFTH